MLKREEAAAINRRLLVEWASAPLLPGAELDTTSYIAEAREERDAQITRSIDEAGRRTPPGRSHRPLAR